MRVDLPDGQWADLREHINHGTDKHLKRAWRKGKEDPDLAFDIDTELVRAFVRTWQVNDPDGNAIPWTDADAVDRATDDVVDELATKAAELWSGVTAPNAPTPD